ncbi:MAG TPA: outer membrane beta-barrel family protein, partial [Bacteroidia bacterium]|nr:outer membrane beta-barrel family protein [Bacteroidia bacterium]
QSALSAVGSIYDVLKRSPGVLIDQNENISMRGKQNVMVMIDGRITPMSSTDLANFLKSLPSESVEKIEFITNPSSKYDANGTAGIINIILKKDKAIGANVSLHAGYSQGLYPKTNDGFSINERTKKFNIFGVYNYSYRGSANLLTLNSDYYNGSKLVGATIQNEDLKFPITTNMARIGTDFFASDKTTIGFIADGMITQFNSAETTTTYEYDSLNRGTSYNVANSTTPNTINNYSGNLNFKHTFDSAGRELLINVDYASYNNKGYQNVLTDYYNLDNTTATSPTNLYGYLPGNLDIYSFKADYDGQFGKKGRLEAGVKTSYVKTDNNVMVYDGIDNAAPVDTAQSNHFIYTENINATYATYSRTLHKADLQIGLRTEQTISDGNQVTTGQQFSHNFIQVFPTVSINDSIAKDQQLGISATRRIDRPTYNQLNPFRLYVNPTFYLQGNPYLIPQNAYSLQVSDTYKQNYTLTLGYTHTLNAITTVILPFPGSQNIAEQTDENLSTFDTYSANLTTVNQFGKWLNVIVSADAYMSHYIANLASTPLNSDRFLWDINANNNISVSKDLSLELDGFYGSGYDLGYLFIKGSWWAAAGVKLNVMKGKGTIKLNANDIFWTDLTVGTTTFTGFKQSIFVRRDTRFVGISFTYHFGNASTSKSLRSKGGAEEEKNRAAKTG